MKENPNIPFVESEKTFFEISKIGKFLSDIHTKYEEVELYPLDVKIRNNNLIDSPKDLYYVRKMKFAKKDNNTDKSNIIYNNNIELFGVPEKVYEYVINKKSAVEWVMSRQGVREDKNTGIVNDANDFANETMNNPKYPLELLQRVITVSMKTLELKDELPELKIAKKQPFDI